HIFQDPNFSTTSLGYYSGQLKGGYYNSISEICFEIVTLYYDLFSEEQTNNDLLLGLEHTFVDYRNSITISSFPQIITPKQIPFIKIFANKSLFSTLLGLESESISDSISMIMFSISSSITSFHPTKLPLYKRLYICCDFILHEYVSNSAEQLLASLYVKPQNNFFYSTIQNQYHSVTAHTLNSLGIHLMCDIQNHVSFPFPEDCKSDEDFVECTLHFRKKSLI
ncbi:MAG: hypothetical protein FD143_3198, partial [Ignavibacteria bacterium]